MAHHFLTIIYRLPQDLLSSLLHHAITALSLQERYSLVGSCKFLVHISILSRRCSRLTLVQLTLMRDTFSHGDLTREADALMELHGKQIAIALIYGVANVAPRSTIQNLSEVLHCMASRRPAQTRAYLTDILFSVSRGPRLEYSILTNCQPDFTAKNPMATQKVKEQFLTSLLS